jgi:hypothetical protein
MNAFAAVTNEIMRDETQSIRSLSNVYNNWMLRSFSSLKVPTLLNSNVANFSKQYSRPTANNINNITPTMSGSFQQQKRLNVLVVDDTEEGLTIAIETNVIEKYFLIQQSRLLKSCHLSLQNSFNKDNSIFECEQVFNIIY